MIGFKTACAPNKQLEAAQAEHLENRILPSLLSKTGPLRTAAWKHTDDADQQHESKRQQHQMFNLLSSAEVITIPVQHLGSNHVHQQVDDTIGVAPLVVIPRHDLEEALLTWQIVLERGLRIVDRGV